jgi:glucosamine--fructose-6-phosphate aminotransferase (isomerizing)
MPTKVPFAEAMRSQPESLALAYSTLRNDLARSAPAPWGAGEMVGVVAMGASSHSGHALVAMLASVGVRAVNLVASDLALGARGFQPADHYILVSESGRSPEPIAAGRDLTVGRRIGISNFPEAAIAEVVDVPLGLGGFDDSGVYTSGYTATLLAYALLLDRMGVIPAGPEVARIPETVRSALEQYGAVAADIGPAFGAAASIDVIGRGTSYASAAEAALMFREGLRVPSAAFETLQYLHGPMEPVAEGSVLLIFGDGRELTVPDAVLESGARVVLVTTASESEVPAAGHRNLTIVPVASGLGGFVRPIVEIVFAQLVMARAIEDKGFTLDEFLYTQDDTKLDEDSVTS